MRCTLKSVAKRVILTVGFFLTSACGFGGGTSRAPSASQALSSSAEWLEFEPVQVRRDLFREVARQSSVQAGHRGAVLFPMLVDGEFVGAPGLEARTDLLAATDAGADTIITFDEFDPFAADRRDAFQGLSEREAAELIGRSLLQLWKITPVRPVNIVRVAGAPYAAAWIEGELRLNPAFVTMAAAPTGS
jgi:hypothetical protein